MWNDADKRTFKTNKVKFIYQQIHEKGNLTNILILSVEIFLSVCVCVCVTNTGLLNIPLCVYM